MRKEVVAVEGGRKEGRKGDASETFGEHNRREGRESDELGIPMYAIGMR